MNQYLTFSIFCSFDIQLEAFGVDTLELKKPAAIRKFKSWIKDWEEEARLNPGEVNMIRLCEKYKNLKFLDPDTGKMFRISEDQMKFFKGNNKKKIDKGWSVITVYGESEDDAEPWPIGDMLCNVIKETDQDEGVEVVTKQHEI